MILFNHELLNKLEDLNLMASKLKAEDILFTAVTPLETSAPFQQPYSVWEKVSNSPSKYVAQSPSILLQAPSINSVSTPTFHPPVNSPSMSPISKKEKSSKSTSKSSKAKSKSTKSVEKSSKSMSNSIKSNMHDDFSHSHKKYSGKSNKRSSPLDVVGFEKISSTTQTAPTQNSNLSSASHPFEGIGASTLFLYILVYL